MDVASLSRPPLGANAAAPGVPPCPNASGYLCYDAPLRDAYTIFRARIDARALRDGWRASADLPASPIRGCSSSAHRAVAPLIVIATPSRVTANSWARREGARRSWHRRLPRRALACFVIPLAHRLSSYATRGATTST